MKPTSSQCSSCRYDEAVKAFAQFEILRDKPDGNCWDLVRRWCRSQGFELPLIPDGTLAPGRSKTSTPRSGDIALMAMIGQQNPSHVAVVLRNKAGLLDYLHASESVTPLITSRQNLPRLRLQVLAYHRVLP